MSETIYPLIYAPTVADKLKVIDALYDNGWCWGGQPDKTVVLGWIENATHKYVNYPYFIFDDDAEFVVVGKPSFGLPKTKTNKPTTLCNSLPHFISYCKNMSENGPKKV